MPSGTPQFQDLIVNYNLSGFSPETLPDHNVEAVRPDDFLTDLLHDARSISGG
ncbi:hypothetical protein [Saccharopolyspora spinosa]|uniref:hypothetical protein n=1 Tax=Saccharopolyspora spinosa TaxID=60894 RepID=UPI000237B090|nr:hypothetical protein [Saccharopolyspora spinosa]